MRRFAIIYCRDLTNDYMSMEPKVGFWLSWMLIAVMNENDVIIIVTKFSINIEKFVIIDLVSQIDLV